MTAIVEREFRLPYGARLTFRYLGAAGLQVAWHGQGPPRIRANKDGGLSSRTNALRRGGGCDHG